MRRTPPVLLAVAALGAAAGIAMLAAEVSTVVAIDVQIGPEGSSCVAQLADPEQADRCELSGLERHGGALILLGLVSFAMALGAGFGRSRPAAVALCVIGLVVLGLALLFDLPETDETGAIGRNFEGATAAAGAGFFLELVAGALALAAGSLALAARRREP